VSAIETAPAQAPRGVEANGINTIAEAERRGRPRDLFLPWFAANVSVFGISYGAFTLFYGLSVAQGLIAGVIGLLVSFGAVGLVATAGPRGSVPTMVLSRAAFGVRGNRVPSALSWLLMVGWETVLVVLGTLACSTVFSRLGVGSETLVKVLALVVIAALVVAAGVAGFDAVMRLQGVITVVAGVLTVAFMALTVDEIDWDAATSGGGVSTAGFIGVVVLLATGFGFGWVNVSADYSRYLPRSTPRGPIFGWTVFGGAIAPLLLLAFGLLLAGSSDKLVNDISADPVGALAELLPDWFLVPFVIVAALGLAAGAVMDIYSSGLALLSAGVPIPRYVAAAVDGVLMLAGATVVVFFTDNFLAQFQGFLITLGVPIAAWIGVIVADVLMRRQDYASAELHDAGGRYGDVRVLPLVLMAIGSVVGWGLVTNTAAGWLDWQGYLLDPLGLGGKDGDWAGAGLGVLFALLLGFLGTLLLGRATVRAQERA
jgi:nucleobase:cation symporter-1, NCS1 family